jgi:uncharacterized protein YoxC
VLVASTAGDAASIALAVFLVAVGLSLGYAFFRLGETFGRLSSFIRGTEREVMPILSKVGGSVDRVNAQLDKLDQATDSAVDAVDAIDQAVRSVSFAVRTPVQKLAGLTAGVSHGVATLRTKRSWSAAVDRGKEASRRRQADLEEELRRHHHHD